MSGLVASALPGEHYCKTLWSTVLPDSRVACMWSAAAARALLARSSSDSTSRVEPCHLKMERGAVMRKRGGTQGKEAGCSGHQQQQNAVSWGPETRSPAGYAPVATSPSLPPCLPPSTRLPTVFISRHVKSRGNKGDWHSLQSHTCNFLRFFFHALILTLLLALSLSCYTNPEP